MELTLAACQGIELLTNRLHPFVCAHIDAAVVHSRCLSHAPDERWDLTSHLLSSRKLRDRRSGGRKLCRATRSCPHVHPHAARNQPHHIRAAGSQLSPTALRIMPKYQRFRYYSVPPESLFADNIIVAGKELGCNGFFFRYAVGFYRHEKPPSSFVENTYFQGGGRGARGGTGLSHWRSTMLRTRSTSMFFRTSSLPPIQRISTWSTRLRLPNPKCRRVP